MCYIVCMYIDRVPNRNSPPAILVRESHRENGKVVKRTLANITRWPKHVIAGLELLFKGKPLIPRDELYAIERSIPHGHVELLLAVIRSLGIDRMISAKPCRERNIVLAMIAERLIHPCSKLATTRLWHTTTLAEELRVGDADVDELYDALDWLLERQRRIEKKLAARHLTDGGLVLYDVSSSYYEGTTCPLAQFGHNRDGKEGKQIIVYGVMTDAQGHPVSIDVYAGDTVDPSTVADQTAKLRARFGLSRVVLVGDRGMLTQARIDAFKEHRWIGWISALRSDAIRSLVDDGELQLSLFDEQDLAEVETAEYPGERLIACYNPLLRQRRSKKREALLTATIEALKRIQRQVARRTNTPLKADEIGVKVGKVLNKYKMGKHIRLQIRDNHFSWEIGSDSVEAEQRLDGVYVIRTSEPRSTMSAADTVRNYKRLTTVERAFLCLKSIDLLVRPIRHRTEDHVRAHIFLCFIAAYIHKHLRDAWAPILFEEEELESLRTTRDPVKPARSSPEVERRKRERRTADDLPVHSFGSLIQELATRCKNRCRFKEPKDSPSFCQITEPTPIQRKAFELLGLKCAQ